MIVFRFASSGFCCPKTEHISVYIIVKINRDKCRMMPASLEASFLCQSACDSAHFELLFYEHRPGSLRGGNVIMSVQPDLSDSNSAIPAFKRATPVVLYVIPSAVSYLRSYPAVRRNPGKPEGRLRGTIEA